MVNDAANSANIETVTFTSKTLLKVALLILGIIDSVHYNGDERTDSTLSVLLIVGGTIFKLDWWNLSDYRRYAVFSNVEKV